MYNKSAYRGSVMLGTSNQIVASVLSVKGEFDKYKGLHEKNLELMKVNADLEKELLRLQATIERYRVDTLYKPKLFLGDPEDVTLPFEYSIAEIVDKSTLTKNNYITINKGYNQGVEKDMGVLSSMGVVGIVVAVGREYSKVLPLINNGFSLSCKFSSNNYTGSLQWDGESSGTSVLTHLPKHTPYHEGDSIYTSGFSAIFPQNIFVGTIQEEVKSIDDNFLALRVNLATNFETLKYVYLIKNDDKEEIDKLKEEESYNR